MELTKVLSMLAILISVASFALSFHVAFRDRPRLKITSKFFEASEWGPAKMLVAMVNVGRRPVILRLLGGSDSDGKGSAEYLEHGKGGLRLGEHERYETYIEKEQTLQFVPDGDDILFERMWVEDSLGTRHPIPNSAEYIRKLWA